MNTLYENALEVERYNELIVMFRCEINGAILWVCRSQEDDYSKIYYVFILKEFVLQDGTVQLKLYKNYKTSSRILENYVAQNSDKFIFAKNKTVAEYYSTERTRRACQDKEYETENDKKEKENDKKAVLYLVKYVTRDY